MKRVFGFLTVMAISLSLVGCTSTADVEPQEEVKETVERPVQEEVKEPVKPTVKSDDIKAAYEHLRPTVEQMAAGLDYDYDIIDDAIYLTGYITEQEFSSAIANNTWKKNVDDLKTATKVISTNLRDAGYYDVKFNFAYCDKELRQQKSYLVVRDGRVVYDLADELDIQ
jgi:hypothetical protein